MTIRRALIILLVIALPLWALAETMTVEEGLLQEALAENQLYRNAVYLFLRLASGAWIAVEWVAAFLLWRAYRLLANAVAARP